MDDHMKVIARRMKLRLKTGETRKQLEKYLKNCGWSDSEVKRILDKAEK